MLGFFELPEEEVPPEHIWHHHDRLEEWFAAVKQSRSDQMAGVESVPAADGDEEMLSNSLTKGWR